MTEKQPFFSNKWNYVKIILIAAFFISGLYQVAKYQAKPPSIPEIRANPSLLKLKDYPDKIALHTRLSTLFTRNTDQAEIIGFMDKAGIVKTDETFFECTHKVSYGHASFIFNFPEKTLAAVKVDNWPDFQKRCKKSEIPEGEVPIKLPLMPLPNTK